MSGQVVAWDRAWVGQTRRQPIEIQLSWPRLCDKKGFLSATRVAMGAAVGAVFGASTLYLGLWIDIDAAAGFALNQLMPRAR